MRFDPARATLQYATSNGSVDLSDTVCRAKRKLQATTVVGIVVVGRFDQRPLRRAARQHITSNEALAQTRADSVAQYLESDEMCGPGLAPIIAVIGAPRSGKPGAAEDGLAADRSVEIYAVTTSDDQISTIEPNQNARRPKTATP